MIWFFSSMIAVSQSTVACSVDICCMSASNAAFGIVTSSTLLTAFPTGFLYLYYSTSAAKFLLDF